MTKVYREVVLLAVLLLSSAIVSYGQEKKKERSLSTAVASMEQLLETERLAIQTLDEFATALEAKVLTIRNGVNFMRLNNQRASADAEKFLQNPINGFNLLRRTHEDWLHWLMYLKEPVGLDKIEYLAEIRTDLPTSNDLNEAVFAITRLQTTYDIKPDDMIKGILNGVQYDSKMSALDAYRIGFDLLSKGSAFEACFWLYAALNAFEPNELNQVYKMSQEKIFRIYAEALVEQNRFKDAVSVLKKLEVTEPHSAHLIQRIREIEHRALTEHTPVLMSPPQYIDSYILGCRGQYPRKQTNLHCRYNTTTTSFLKIAPLKLEEVSLDPYMILYHDVLYDSEIEVFKEMALPNLRRATVYTVNKGTNEVINRRTSQFAWFGDDHNKATERVTARIADMTGFNLVGSEMLQLMNYGLAGHYDTHYDFFNVSATEDVVRKNGDRKSTVLFYMSDVEQGGATVFPNIGVTVYPKKGAAVMWYNLNNEGEPDANTLHAACPVLVGTKWVCNKWIREKNQVFKCPCYKN